MSPECRRELQFFARQATRLGIKELVLPLLYVEVPSLQDEAQRDDLLELVRTFQWEDWRELRFSDVSSESYRRGIARLAVRLVEANRQIEVTDVAANALQAYPDSVGTDDDLPGFLDRMASGEETLPKLVATIEEIGGHIESIGQIMRDASSKIELGDKQGKGFAARLLVARKVAHQLAEPVEHVWSLSNDFASQLHEVDQGIRAIIERAPAEVEQDSDAKAAVCYFFQAVRYMSSAARDGLSSVQGMIDATEPLEKMSRDLRPALRRLRQELTTMVEARDVSDEWVRLIDGSGITCDDIPLPGG